jgi:thiamine-phosphate pyrophosphorylase
VRLPDPPILVITDRSLSAESLETRAEALFRGGCRWLSLREKDLSPAARQALLGRLTAIGAHYGATIGVHGDPAAARPYRSALHLPAGADLAEARRRLGPGRLIGQSCHGLAETVAAAAADYVTLSPIFATTSKPGYGPGFSAEDIAAVTAAAPTLVLALGGITIATLPKLKGTGVAGIALIGEAMQTPEPETWFAQLSLAWASRTI